MRIESECRLFKRLFKIKTKDKTYCSLCKKYILYCNWKRHVKSKEHEKQQDINVQARKAVKADCSKITPSDIPTSFVSACFDEQPQITSDDISSSLFDSWFEEDTIVLPPQNSLVSQTSQLNETVSYSTLEGTSESESIVNHLQRSSEKPTRDSSEMQTVYIEEHEMSVEMDATNTFPIWSCGEEHNNQLGYLQCVICNPDEWQKWIGY